MRTAHATRCGATLPPKTFSVAAPATLRWRFMLSRQRERAASRWKLRWPSQAILGEGASSLTESVRLVMHEARLSCQSPSYPPLLR